MLFTQGISTTEELSNPKRKVIPVGFIRQAAFSAGKIRSRNRFKHPKNPLMATLSVAGTIRMLAVIFLERLSPVGNKRRSRLNLNLTCISRRSRRQRVLLFKKDQTALLYQMQAWKSLTILVILHLRGKKRTFPLLSEASASLHQNQPLTPQSPALPISCRRTLSKI